MKKKYIFIIIAFVLSIITIYYVDRKFYMPQRINNHLWDWEAGEPRNTFGDFIYSEKYHFSGDTMIFYTDKKAIVRYQYFGTLSIRDVETGNIFTYEMKGTNWWESM